MLTQGPPLGNPLSRSALSHVNAPDGERCVTGLSQGMPCPRQPARPFRYLNSSAEVIRLRPNVEMYGGSRRDPGMGRVQA